MNTWKIILATLVIFGAGVITGGLLVSYSDRALHPVRRAALPEKSRQGTNAFPAPGREIRPGLLAGGPLPFNAPLHRDFLDRLARELRLEPGQRERIAKVVSEGQQRIKELSQKVEPQIHAELAATRERIKAELTPEQQARFAELFKPQRAREWHRGGPGHSATNPPAWEPTNAPAVSGPTNSPVP